MKSFTLLLLIASGLSHACGYHVLCVFPVPSRSHNHLAKGIVDSLLDAGHKVTWGTPFPQKSERANLRQIDLSVTVPLAEAVDMTDLGNAAGDVAFVKAFARNVTEATLQTQELRQVVTSEQFDAVVTEWFFSDTDAGYAAVQGVPWILLSGMVMTPHLEMLTDDVRSIPTHPLMMNPYPVPMNLWQRLKNTVIYLVMTAGYLLDFSSNEAFYHKHFAPIAAARGVPLTPFADALYNISILLVNSHTSLTSARSQPPNVVDIAGYHIAQDVPPLPKDLQDLLDSSTKGVVYFSMGSVLKSSAFPEKTQRALLKVLGELPYTVLWKFEKELKNLPKNVHVRAWMPQASILAHPNIKVFITHGGLLSTLEAARYGVPMLAVPVFGDQPSNAERSARLGVARRVTFSPDMAEELKRELKIMLEDDSYLKKAKEVSRLFNNRPVHPSKLVSHYIEVAIESKGAYHLRSPSKLYAWYERWMLDQIAIVIAILYVLYLIVKKILCAIKNIFVTSKKVKRN